MTAKRNNNNLFPSAEEDALHAAGSELRSQSRSYKLAYTDEDFLLKDELRAVRLQLEWLKPDILQTEQNINATVVLFGGARFTERSSAESTLKEIRVALDKNPADPALKREYRVAERIVQNSRFYEEARNLARLIVEGTASLPEGSYSVVTGGGPGLMEAANRGAQEAGGKSIGLNIVLPREQRPNPYITEQLCFQFHYFAIRKMHFLKRARALVACPGGFGTLDELFETLTLIQTGKVKPMPVILLGREYWSKAINFEHFVAEGAIDADDLSLFTLVDSAQEAWETLDKHWKQGA
ncbi:MAG TPA: TIGR00730 family Rossman fold protein [Porticoccaceae bacterium]|nr:TIGR00730 family Rossman fold protein [Porticoccaceae bacterium]HCO60241.1 TIGR00730 family Rossman fold protein [Porticoccaceae bacterium]